MTTALTVDIDKVEPDPNQPRKTFDKGKLDELAISIKAHGIVTPLVLRPHPTKNHGSLMIVDGERRWRAAELAGLTEVPFVLRELDDKQALEQQIVANSQREDVPPLEEAESYQALLDDHGYTMELLVEKTGKSKSHLYSRLQLLKLAPGVKKALVAGRISASIATLAGTIPNHKLQEQYIEDVLGNWKEKDRWEREEALSDVGIQHEDMNDDGRALYGGHDSKPHTLSYRAAQALLHRRYSTRLALAKFDPTRAKSDAVANPSKSFEISHSAHIDALSRRAGDLDRLTAELGEHDLRLERLRS